MKKYFLITIVVLLSIITFTLIFNTASAKKPESYYQVYLDNEIIGIIESKDELLDYINSQGEVIKENVENYMEELDVINDTVELLQSVKNSDYNELSNQDKAEYLLNNSNDLNLSEIKKNTLNEYLENKYYDISDDEINEIQDYVDTNEIYLTANTVYTPNGIEIKKITTYESNVEDIPTIYNRIISKKACTVAGYKFTIKSETQSESEESETGYETISKEIIIYVIDPEIFKQSIDTVAKVFIGDTEYDAYKNNTQTKITTTGSYIDNVYVEENITYKAVNIDVGEKIYTTSEDLTKFLLYGDNYDQKYVTVEEGDSLETIAIENEISVDELLISNPEYTSRYSLLYPGKKIIISKLYPQISIVSETYDISDIETNYSIVEQYDSSMNQGNQVVVQQGENGVERVTQNVKKVNGQITYVEPISKETLKAATNEIVSIGTNVPYNVGSTTSWGWPTNSGYTLSSYYGYRLAVFGEGNFHSGLDIAGTGYGSPVMATNNGTIIELKDLGNTSYGRYILIDHNNGYYTLYGHMSAFASGLKEGMVVERGQVIGYVGSTGWATGPHLHYEIRVCAKYACTVNPLNYY